MGGQESAQTSDGADAQNRAVKDRIVQFFRDHIGAIVPIVLALFLLFLELGSNSVSYLISGNVDTGVVPDWFSAGRDSDGELQAQYKHFVDTIARIGAPILLGSFALFAASISIFEAKRKSTIEVLKTKIDASNQYASSTLDYARQDLEKAEAARKEAISKAEEHRKKIADIKNHIDRGSSYKERIRVGVFARLLAYAPMYVAQHLKFFEDEGLTIDLKVAGGDDEVAAGLRTGEFDFGICDPVFVLEDKAKSTERLKIIIPIAKRLDITVVCKHGVLEDKLNQKITIAAFKPPSTTYASALKLKLDFEAAGLFEGIEIKELNPEDERLLDPTLLATLVSEFDFVLLWNPATSWLYQGLVPGVEQFGRLACLRKPGSPAKPEHWCVKSFGEDGAIIPANEYMWNPNNAKTHGHQILASGLLASEFMETHRRELCRKMFRAISRALVRIEGANWALEAAEKTPFKLRKMIEETMDDGDYLSDVTLKRLISDSEASSMSIFPFVQGIHVYGQGNYSRHLRNLRLLWENDTSVNSRFQLFKAPKDYAVFFARLRD